MLYSAFVTKDTDKRDAIISWIYKSKQWIETVTFSDRSTLMQRAVHLHHLDALERMICYLLDPYKSINDNYHMSKSDKREKLKGETRDKIVEIMKRHYAGYLEKLTGSQSVSIIDRAELINSMLFFSTSMHDVVLIMNFVVVHLQLKETKAAIQKGLSMATSRCFVYENDDRKLFIKLVLEMTKREILSEEEKYNFLAEATKVNTENSDWVRCIKVSIQRLDERLTATESGLLALQNNFQALVTALRDRERREAEKEKIRLAISLTCASLALFGGLLIKELLECVVFMDNPGLILDAITEISEEVASGVAIKEGVKHVLERALILPSDFLTKLQEAQTRLSDESKDVSTVEGADDGSTHHGSTILAPFDKDEKTKPGLMNEKSYGIDCFDQNDNCEKKNVSAEDNMSSQANAKKNGHAKGLSMWDIVKMIQSQQKEKKAREEGTFYAKSDRSFTLAMATKSTFVDLSNVSKRDFRPHTLHYAVYVSAGDKDEFVLWTKSISSNDLSLNDTIMLRVREVYASEHWEDKECSAILFASYMGYKSIVDWFIDQGNLQTNESPFLIRCRADDIAEAVTAA